MVSDVDNVCKIIHLDKYRFDTYKKQEVENELEPIAGDPVVGELTNELMVKFIELSQLEWLISDIEDDLYEKMLITASYNVIKQIHGEDTQHSTEELFHSYQEYNNYLKAKCEFEFRQKELQWLIRSQVGNFTHMYEIRQGFKIVITGPRPAQL